MLSNTEQHKIFVVMMQDIIDRNDRMLDEMKQRLWSSCESEFLVSSFFFMQILLMQLDLLQRITKGMTVTRCEYTRLRKDFIDIMTENMLCDDNIRIH